MANGDFEVVTMGGGAAGVAAGRRLKEVSIISKLTGLLGKKFALIAIHRWSGSYSFALPGMADCRAALAAPVDGRLDFADVACSRRDFLTAHGGWLTGRAAADPVIAVRARKR